MIMDALPLNPNGKIDRARLPDPRTADPVHDQPTTATEEAIARIWSAVLKIDKSALGRDQDFFDLGGHSLLLTQVASRLRTELEVDVPLRSLFGVRRLADLAALVAGSARTSRPASPSSIAKPIARRSMIMVGCWCRRHCTNG